VVILHLLSGKNKKAQRAWYYSKPCCAFTCSAWYRNP